MISRTSGSVKPVIRPQRVLDPGHRIRGSLRGTAATQPEGRDRVSIGPGCRASLATVAKGRLTAAGDDPGGSWRAIRRTDGASSRCESRRA